MKSYLTTILVILLSISISFASEVNDQPVEVFNNSYKLEGTLSIPSASKTLAFFYTEMG
jgi:hypothetical protein